jgi:hypothetical protein
MTRKPAPKLRSASPPKPRPTDFGNKETGVSVPDESAIASRPVETTEGAMDEYLARQDAERAKMARLREMRLTAEARADAMPEAKAKRKTAGKGKARAK